MRISELLRETEQLVELSRPLGMAEAEAVLHKAGYHELGRGIFATVLAKSDSSHCLKLFDSDDAAYKKFVALAMQNPNPHFPRFRGKLMKVTDRYYAIRMETLTPFPKTTENQLLAMQIDDYIAEIKRGNQMLSSQMATMDELEKTQPGIKKACELIGTTLSSRIIDIHLENIMLRGDTIVITDPVV